MKKCKELDVIRSPMYPFNEKIIDIKQCHGPQVK